MAGEGPALAEAFQIAALLLAVASLVGLARPAALSRTAGHALRHWPLRSTLLLLNLGVFALLLLQVAHHWGVVLIMLGLAGGLLLLTLTSEARRLAAVGEIVRGSPVSFMVLYLALIGGELYLRQHPMLVGGGGGGNPALRRLYQGLYQFNSLGLRDDEPASLDAPDRGMRILALGDSFTFGQGVAHEELWTEVLQRMIQAHVAGPCEVINTGRPGVNTDWEVRYLHETGLALAPDGVVLQFFANDVDIMYDATPSQKLLDKITRPLRRSHVIFFLDDRLTRLGRKRDLNAYMATRVRQIDENNRGWQMCAAALADLVDTARAHGVPVLVVIFPEPGADLPANAELNSRVAQWCRQLDLPVLDLTQIARQLPIEARIVSPIDHHPGAALHALAAREIFSHMQGTNWLVERTADR